MSQRDIEKRINASVYAARRKRWYQRWWGRVVIGILFLLAAFFIVFVIRVIEVYNDVRAGKITSEQFIDELRQDARIDLLHNGNDPSEGPIDAPVTIVAFEDFECPFCFQAQPFISKLRTIYGSDVRFIYKDFPLNSIHPRAQLAAEAAQCAHEQGKFWEFHDELFTHQDRLAEAYYRTVAKEIGMNINTFNACVATGKYKAAVAEDVELGRSLGVFGTPTFFVNGELFAQGYSAEIDHSFETAIEYIKSL